MGKHSTVVGNCRPRWPCSLMRGSAAAGWDCGFEFRRAHGCLSLLSVECCQVEVFGKGRSFAERSLTESAVCLSVMVKIHRGGLGPLGLSSNGK